MVNTPGGVGGRALGLDLGTRRIGVAICDDLRTVATPLATVDRVGDRRAEHDRIAGLISEHDVAILVVGLPLSLNGELGPAAKTVLSEVKALRRHLAIEVVTHDERLSTITAEAALQRQGINRRKGRAVVDQLAASVILQSWIDAQHGTERGLDPSNQS